jgi:Arc/MetJ-type ribon-helix-helix transcriptional regulator
MSMSVSIPTYLQPFVERELATGAFADEADLVTKALELLREMKTRHEQLRGDVQRSLAQAERGEVAPLDIQSIKDVLRSELDEAGKPKQ